MYTENNQIKKSYNMLFYNKLCVFYFAFLRVSAASCEIFLLFNHPKFFRLGTCFMPKRGYTTYTLAL
jgi:hypothetical protein